MKRSVVAALLAVGLVLASAGAFADKACKFSDPAKLKEHIEKHITYPAKGKDIKEACKKEIPDEFTKAERACVAKKLKDGTEYKSADEVMKALGVQK